MIETRRPYYGDEEIEEIVKVVRSAWTAGGGPTTLDFERAVSRYLRIPENYVASCNSCTSGLTAILEYYKQKYDIKKVAVAAFTFPATLNAIKAAGLRYMFVDVNLGTFNIDWKNIPECDCIVPVDTFGVPANYLKLSDYGLPIAADSACSFGSLFNTEPVNMVTSPKLVGSYYDFGVDLSHSFSLHGTKVLAVGEGGIVTGEAAEFARTWCDSGLIYEGFRNHRRAFVFPKFVEGRSQRLSAIHAGMGIAQLKKLNSMLMMRGVLRNRYLTNIEQMENDGINFYHPQHSATRYSVQSMVVRTTKPAIPIINMLRERGIGCTIGYFDISKGKCKNASFLQEHTIALPMHPGLTTDDVDRICKEMAEVVTNE